MATAWQTVSMNYSSILSVSAQSGLLPQPSKLSPNQLSPLPCPFLSLSPLPCNSYLVLLFSLSTRNYPVTDFLLLLPQITFPPNGLEYFLGHTQNLTYLLLVLRPSSLLSPAFFLVQVIEHNRCCLPPSPLPKITYIG